ncbi:CaiB/BaiF CoA transferase family protein [Dactylosporangium sp. CA-233914]|uniref:CaiB/BaiF CoA transferase family protein n=1 Tax=Dactylosporangium sp. CA-233914 TaxID=3239934 RepID=UPI003D8A5087
MSTAHTSTGPLAGLRVVELAGIGPGPHACMVLADFGADVVRIERPTPGLDVLSGKPDHLLRSRRSFAADLKNADDLAAVRRLIDAADVLVEGYRPGVAERLGLGPEVVLEANPRLVYARMTGWGQHGPRARTAGHDINYIALTGALHSIARPGQPPSVPVNLVGDFGGGSMLCLVGVLAALWERECSGRGQVIDVAMVDGASLLMQMTWAMFGAGAWVDRPASNLLDGGAPFYDVYQCADGRYVALGALEPPFYAALLAGLGLDAAELPEQYDRAGWPELRARIAARLATRTRDEWTAVFAGTDACVTPVLSLAEAPADPHLSARGTFTDIDGTTQPAPAPRFSRSTPTNPRPPRTPGADNESVLRDWLAPDVQERAHAG